jgi:hypothetical protein
MTNPLLVEIIAYAPTAFYHCTHCEVAWREIGVSNHIHEEQLKSSLPDDLARDYQAVSDWVREIFRLHCDAVVVKVIDAASLEGVFSSLRYRARHYPAIIVDHQKCFQTNAMESAGEEISRRLRVLQPSADEEVIDSPK